MDSRAQTRALLDAARSVHESLELSRTLSTIARGAAVASGFTVAAVNLRRPDGSFETVAVEGDGSVGEALLGQIGSAELWHELLTGSRAWGELRFVHHDDPLASIDMPSWRPELAESDDPRRWHPDDILFAPLTDREGGVIGILSVDVPGDGLLPGESQREMLELFAHHAATAIVHATLFEALAASTDELRRAATHDRLTGLRNRSVFDDEVPRLTGAHGSEVAMLVVDLDRFKEVNDTDGHHVGDLLLVEVAARMRACVRHDELLARTGGDEFIVVLAGPDARLSADGLAARIRLTIAEPVLVEGKAWQIGASVGIAVAPGPVDHGELLAAADADMYRQKRSARGVPAADRR
ncbi:GGDEF domain-containing protein [Herbiconiux moechotypicola]|uniref:GGDEF domain-containing protein n=1 Tax=Herbiconiux moechotypicola TaxID=637393 RepID=A0ABP5Q0W3_9MICO|nr:GGDEF domain-containing protein [Herbiconiux moechotypicola]MCS5728534.1 GGDEF domain-containing protein [Herbiconiux moechotypicola]